MLTGQITEAVGKIRPILLDTVAKVRKAAEGAIRWLSDVQVYPTPMFVVIGGSVHYKVRGPQMRKVLETVRPGDVLLRRFSGYLGSLLVPGYWGHAAIYVGDGRVVHMLGGGIASEDILSFLRCDDVAILRHGSQTQAEAAVGEALRLRSEGVEYDFLFSLDSRERMYCTELVDRCYFGVGVRSPVVRGFICPDDLLDSELELVWRP